MERMITTYKLNGEQMTVFMPKEIDHHVSTMLSKEIDFLVDTHGVRELLVDFEGTEFMDSSGIGVIIGRSRVMQFRGGRICVSHLNKRVEMIFHSAI